MRVLLLIVAALIVLSSRAQSTTTLTGKIESNAGVIPGATIRVLGTGQGVASNSEGKFKLEGLAPGEYKVEFRSIGYKPQVKTVQIGSRPHELNITLEESVLDMNEVVVTGTMKPMFVTQSPIKVEIVTSKHINTYMPAAASGLVESISLVNGVQEVTACGVCFTNSISINGLPGPYTAVLMDGTPIYGNLASVYGLNGIPSMIIDRFEIIKGPSSTLYGSEAVAGVINIITKDPESQPIFSVDLMATSHMESFGNVAIAPKLKNASGFIGLNYAYINDFDDVNEDGFGDMANLDRISIFTKWDIKRKSNKPFTVAAKYYYEDRRNGVEAFIKDRNYQHLRGSEEVYGESIYTNRGEIFGTYALPTNERFKIDYSMSYHHQDSYYGSDYYRAKQAIAFANFIWQKELGKHQVLGGLTSRYQQYNDNTVATTQTIDNSVVDDPNNQYIPGVFAQDEWELTPYFTMLTGGRLDHYTEHGFIFAPRLNLKYKVGQWTTFRSNFGTGFRVVNLFTEDHAFLSGQREVVIAEKLNPERSFNFSLNANHIYTMGSSQGSIDVDAYFTHFTNKIIPSYDNPDQIVYENTNGYAVTKGIGISATQEFTFPLAMNIGFNIQQATETEKLDSLGSRTSNIEFAPRWSGVLTANYNLKSWKLSLAYTFRVTGPMRLPEVYDLDSNGEPIDQPRPTTSAPFAIHNLQVNKNFKGRFALYGGVQNIFNFVQEYSPLVGYNDPSAPPGFGNFDTSYAYAPIHGREFYLGFSWSVK